MTSSTSSPVRVREPWTVAMVTLAAVAFILALSRKLAPLRFEDALIVLRYARNIASGQGFVFNPGEPLLGVTSPLQTLLAALVTFLAPDRAPVLVNAIGVSFLTLSAVTVGFLLRAHYAPAASCVAALLLLANLNFTYLYVGMEVPLYSFLVLLSFAIFMADRKSDGLLGVVLGIAFLTRYDAALWAAFLGSFLWVETRRFPYRVTLGFAVVTLPWLVFAWLYFGTIVPESLIAKSGHTGVVRYLEVVYRHYASTFAALGLRSGAPWVVGRSLAFLFPFPCAVGGRILVRADRRFALLFAYTAAHVLVYAGIGADPGFSWHYFILNAVLFMCFAVGLCALLATLVSKLAYRRVALVALAGLLFAPLFFSVIQNLRRPYRPTPRQMAMRSMAAWIRERYEPDESLLNPSIGILGYETGLRMIDHAGLVTPGLHYYDGRRHTPLEEVLRSYEPSLVLLPAATPLEKPFRYGYRLRKRFRGRPPYLLYEHERLRRGEPPP